MTNFLVHLVDHFGIVGASDSVAVTVTGIVDFIVMVMDWFWLVIKIIF